MSRFQALARRLLKRYDDGVLIRFVDREAVYDPDRDRWTDLLIDVKPTGAKIDNYSHVQAGTTLDPTKVFKVIIPNGPEIPRAPVSHDRVLLAGKEHPVQAVEALGWERGVLVGWTLTVAKVE